MSSNCKKIEEYLVDYLYQELPARKTLEVEKHLRACSDCTQTLESWRAIHRAYQRTTEEPQIAPYTKQKILAVAEEELLRPTSWNEKLLWGLKIATVPIAIFVLVLFLNTKKEPEIAMTKTAPAAPKAVVETPVDSARPAPEETSVSESRQESIRDYEPKRKADSQLNTRDDRPSGRGNEVESDKDKLQALGYVAGKEEPEASSPPPPSVSPASPFASTAERDEIAMEQNAPAAQKTAALTDTSKKAEELSEEAQKQFRSKNVKEGQNLLKQAISYDNRKSLASNLHEQGTTYQNQGEFGLAIAQYESVQNNYKDYARMDDVLLRLGDSYAEIGEFGKAVNAYSQISPAQRKVAMDRIRRLQKKQEAQEQLRSLGYVSDPDKQN